MTDREKLVELIRWIGMLEIEDCEYIADHLIANGVMVQPSPQNNHRKICPTTGLECIACVPGSPCATEDERRKRRESTGL